MYDFSNNYFSSKELNTVRWCQKYNFKHKYDFFFQFIRQINKFDLQFRSPEAETPILSSLTRPLLFTSGTERRGRLMRSALTAPDRVCARLHVRGAPVE